MSYAMSASLQEAVYDRLVSDEVLSGLVGNDIYDAVPTGTVPETYVSIGEERVRDASDQTGNGAIHRFTVTVVSIQPGFAKAKAIGAAISDALHDKPLELSRGRVVSLRFERADASRIDSRATRQIILRFRARVDDDA
ncbi:MAG: DUF3168 domain-containing protein [Roseobacter sp.]